MKVLGLALVLITGFTTQVYAETGTLKTKTLTIQTTPDKLKVELKPGEKKDLVDRVNAKLIDSFETSTEIIEAVSTDDGKRVTFDSVHNKEAIDYFNKYFTLTVPPQIDMIDDAGEVPVIVEAANNTPPGTYLARVLLKVPTQKFTKIPDAKDIYASIPIEITVPGNGVFSASLTDVGIQDDGKLSYKLKNTSSMFFYASGRVDFYTSDPNDANKQIWLGEIPDIKHKSVYPNMVVDAKQPIPDKIFENIEPGTPYVARLTLHYAGDRTLTSEIQAKAPVTAGSALVKKEAPSKNTNALNIALDEKTLILGGGGVLVLLLLTLLALILKKKGEKKERSHGNVSEKSIETGK